MRLEHRLEFVDLHQRRFDQSVCDVFVARSEFSYDRPNLRRILDQIEWEFDTVAGEKMGDGASGGQGEWRVGDGESGRSSGRPVPHSPCLPVPSASGYFAK